VVKGWGLKDESWFIEYKVVYGSPARDQVWDELDGCFFRLKTAHFSA
jgi:phage terminase large subunit GpA-like protein